MNGPFKTSHLSSFTVLSKIAFICVFSCILAKIETSLKHKLYCLYAGVCVCQRELESDILVSAYCAATKTGIKWMHNTHTHSHRKGKSAKQAGISWAGNLPFNKGMHLWDTCVCQFVCACMCVCKCVWGCVFARPQRKYFIFSFVLCSSRPRCKSCHHKHKGGQASLNSSSVRWKTSGGESITLPLTGPAMGNKYLL